MALAASRRAFILLAVMGQRRGSQSLPYARFQGWLEGVVFRQFSRTKGGVVVDVM
jgi:hypothetical protein